MLGLFGAECFVPRIKGKSWQPLNAGLKRKEIKTLLAVDDVVYAGTSDGAYRLNRADDRWSVVTTGLDDDSRPCVGAIGRRHAVCRYLRQGVLRFKANSTGWVRLRHGLKDHEGMMENFIRVLTIDPEGGIYAGTFDGGVFRSADGGTYLAAYQPGLAE